MNQAYLLLLLLGIGASTEWDVPLYLFQSIPNKDIALLPGRPARRGGVKHADSYELVYEHPVAFGSSANSTSTSVPLNLYWSEERSDLQTTDWDVRTLNKHGGNYTSLGKIAWLSNDPEMMPIPRSQVPLLLSYSGARTDAVTSPFNFADINNIPAFCNATKLGFVGKRLLGYAGHGNCTQCDTRLAAAFPSLGGADCPDACSAGTSSFTAIYRVGHIQSGAADFFRKSMLAAGQELAKFGPTDVLESGGQLHVSFQYLCCYSPQQKASIRKVLSSLAWPELNISFSSPVWRIDNTIVPSSPKSKGHHYSIIVLLDQESDDRMQSWVSEVEQRIREQGIPIRFSRSVQQPFHSTLGVVNGLEFPLETALAAVNTVVRPHSWTGGENITLEGPPNF